MNVAIRRKRLKGRAASSASRVISCFPRRRSLPGLAAATCTCPPTDGNRSQFAPAIRKLPRRPHPHRVFPEQLQCDYRNKRPRKSVAEGRMLEILPPPKPRNRPFAASLVTRLDLPSREPCPLLSKARPGLLAVPSRTESRVAAHLFVPESQSAAAEGSRPGRLSQLFRPIGRSRSGSPASSHRKSPRQNPYTTPGWRILRPWLDGKARPITNAGCLTNCHKREPKN